MKCRECGKALTFTMVPGRRIYVALHHSKGTAIPGRVAAYRARREAEEFCYERRARRRIQRQMPKVEFD